MRPDLAAAGPSRLRFEALRNGRRIGEQRTAFEPRGSGLLVTTTAEFAVGIGPLTLYRYRHEATEGWEADRLTSFVSRTVQNGRTVHVSAAAEADGIRIVPASGAEIHAPRTAAPFSHWNREIARRPLFNPQDGRLLRETSTAPFAATIRSADGAAVRGVCIRFRGDAEIDDFYDQDGVWAGLTGKLKDGSTLEYRRL